MTDEVVDMTLTEAARVIRALTNIVEAETIKSVKNHARETMIAKIRAYREETGASLSEAKKALGYE
jgi:ribosomal protein L7/L12